MDFRNRKHSLGIWGFALGYFAFYIPYSALIKAITKGVLPGMNGPVSGFELLPSTVIATAIAMPLFITLMGWWKYAGRRELFGLSVPCPSRWTFVSGLGFAAIIGTTMLAYTFRGVSIVFALLLLRGGVLIMAPLVDRLFRRRVRWFCWAALALSFTSLALAFSDVGNYEMSLLAALNVALYLAGYMVRLPCMTGTAKSRDKGAAYRYFVEEQMVAMPALVAVPALVALFGAGSMAMELRSGFTTFFHSEAIGAALFIGVLYACLSVCGTFVYLDRRENAFCIPLNRCSSLLSGVAASYALTFLYGQEPPGAMQLACAGLIIVAILFLSPLHHFDLYLSRLKDALAIIRLQRIAASRMKAATMRQVLLFVCGGNTLRSPMAQAICIAEMATRLKISADELAKSGIEILSAGISAKPGAPMKPEARWALTYLGVPDHYHSAQPLTPALIEMAEAIYCMTEEQRRTVLEMAPAAAFKTRRLDPDGDIEEPDGNGLESIINCASRIQSIIRNRFDGAAAGAHA